MHFYKLKGWDLSDMQLHCTVQGYVIASCLAACLWLSIGVKPVLAQETVDPDTLEHVIVHEVDEGETLYSISRQYDVSLRQVQEWNDLDDFSIYIGQDLIIGMVDTEAAPLEETEETESTEQLPDAPDQSQQAEADSYEAQASRWPPIPAEYSVLPDLEREVDTSARDDEEPTQDDEEMLPIDEEEEASQGIDAETAGDLGTYGWHELEEGETLYSVAGRYDVTVDTLRALNEPVPAYLSEGDSLRLPPSFAGYFHEVQEGETITDLARTFGVSIRGLQYVNNLETREISPGQQLLIPGRPAPEPEPSGTLPPVNFEGHVQLFPDAFEGRLMAGGVRYDPAELVVSHRDLPIGTVVLVSNPEAGRNTFARVADRGPPDEELIMDISQAVAEALDIDEDRAHVEVRIVE